MYTDASAFEMLSNCSLPTEFGESCELRVYGDRSTPAAQQWVACVWGAGVRDRDSEGVHLRVHDACLTSEVLGSLKCDCAQQLRRAQHHLSDHGGVLIYTPQEGRGIGLASKVAAYALQERGLDTVDANVALGLPAEARDYTAVRIILDHLRIRSVVILTNNPFKVASLRALGITVSSRRALMVDEVAPQCQGYLKTKASRMGHLLEGDASYGGSGSGSGGLTDIPSHDAGDPLPLEYCLEALSDEEAPFHAAQPQTHHVGQPLPDLAEGGAPMAPGAPTPSPLVAEPFAAAPATVRRGKTLHSPEPARTHVGSRRAPEVASCQRLLGDLRTEISAHAQGAPFVTLTYAQALDGSIAGPLGAAGPRLMLSGEKSMTLTHGLRALHDAILVGVGTVLSDDPQLTVRLVDGASPLRVILDSNLRVPIEARALRRVPSDISGPPGVSDPVGSTVRTKPHAVIVALDSTVCKAASADKLAALQSMGVVVLSVPADADGHAHLDAAILQLHGRLGVRSVMVEGGAAVIGTCARAKLAHRVIVTLAPKTLVNGLRPGARVPDGGSASCLRGVKAFCLGDDVVVNGQGPAKQPADVGQLLASRL